jgi:hypothetical protein
VSCFPVYALLAPYTVFKSPAKPLNPSIPLFGLKSDLSFSDQLPKAFYLYLESYHSGTTNLSCPLGTYLKGTLPPSFQKYVLFNLPPFLSIATGTPYLFNSNH